MPDTLIKQLLEIYKHKIKFILSFVIISMVVIVVYSLIVPIQYTSEASLFPPKQPEAGGGLSSFLKNFPSAGLSLGGVTAGNNQGQVFAEILNSRSVAEHIIKQCQLKKMPNFEKMRQDKLIKYVQKSIDVTADKSGMIYISAVYSSPYFTFSREEKKTTAKISQKIAVSAIEALDSIIKKRAINSAKISLKYSQEEVRTYRQKLDSIEDKMQKFQNQNKVLEIEEQTKALLSQQVEIAKELLIAESTLEAAREEYAENSVLIKQAEAQVELLKKQYAKAQKGGMFSDDSYSIPFSNIPGLAKEYTNLYRDKKIYEQILLYLETQKHQDFLQEGKDISQVEILDYPSLPTVQSAPNKFLMLVLGSVLSFIIALAYVAIKAKCSGELIISDNSGKEQVKNIWSN